MQFFYDGQIRRYLLQTMRLLSNFVVKYGDGTLVRVPVMYGDSDRQVANILKQNSENKINSTPRIAVYITDLDLDKDRLADATHVGKVHIRERDIENGEYTGGQGKNYTVERLMPTPYKLTVKADIWTSSTEQKLQLMEQILMLFNPSLEIQTTDNYLDWTSLSVVNLGDVQFSSRSVPVGNDSPIDVASMTFDMPVWISPPAKVKTLGVVTNVIMGIYKGSTPGGNGYIDGLGVDPYDPAPNFADIMSTVRANVDNFGLMVHGNPGSAKLLDAGENVTYTNNNQLYVSTKNGADINWRIILDQYPGQFRTGVSTIYLSQPDGTEVSGTVALNPLDESELTVNWDPDTLNSNINIDSKGYMESFDVEYSLSNSVRSSPGNFDAIIDPEKTKPTDPALPTLGIGSRYLIINNVGGGIRETLTAEARSNRIDTNIETSRVYTSDIKVYVNKDPVAFSVLNINDNVVIRLNQSADFGDIITYELPLNEDGPDAWKNADGSDLIANANDIIEWNGSKWTVVFDSEATNDRVIYQTNIYTNVQYKWDGVRWSKSFEGVYGRGTWRLEL